MLPKSVIVLMLLILISIMGIGDYVYRTGTAVHWSAHLFHTEKTPLRFVTPGVEVEPVSRRALGPLCGP